ncbi:patellin-3-like [Magnolia sinica]|uniref:patellin-3-like n=1 Tax=Magnolia sinica TaxID=86752 RepID=UPI00265B0B19|nr:patellin-3-like [Magnolia sinica]
MAEETQTVAQPSSAPAEEVVAVPVQEKTKDGPPENKTPPVTDPDTEPATTEDVPVPESVSFKEESNRVSDLQDPEKKALEEFKQLIQQALQNREFTPLPPPPKPEEKPDIPPPEEKPATEEPVPEAPVAAAETPKPESDVSSASVAEEEKPPAVVEAPKAEPVALVAEVVEVSVTVTNDDGTKTVEAIEETVVAVSAPSESDPHTKEAKPLVAAAPEPAAEPVPVEPENISIWGVPLLGDERSDVVLLKFLRARDFKPKDAFVMIKNTVRWRKDFGIDGLLEEDLGTDLEKVVFMHGFDKEGHPVCYNVYGEFEDKELYQKTLSDEEKRQKFLRWRIQFLEKGIKQLDFNPGGLCTLVQVNDLRNSPGLGKKELKQATNQALNLLQDNYPEFVAKQIFINVPWWYLAFYRMISPFLTQRTKSKFVFAGASKSAETLFKYIAPEQVPVQYGGLSIENDPDFSPADVVTEVTVKPATKHIVEIPVSETCLLVWELRVLGWDVSYCAEFVPSAKDGYTVIVQKARKLIASDEPVVKNSFKLGEPGKVVLTVDNTSSKKKKLLYRSKTKRSSDSI